MVWLLVLVVYAAPNNAVNWNGPWEFGMSVQSEGSFATESACRNEAIKRIGRIHQDLLAPIRYHCISVPATLPKNAPR